MTGFLTDHDSLAGRILTNDCITLAPEHFEQATTLSASAPSEAAQWQRYLNALARFGLEQWLQERAPDLRFRLEEADSRRFQSPRSLTQLQVGAFTLCLIAVDDAQDTVIPVSKMAIEPPEAMPHFYVLVEVLEELDQICIYGYLRQDEIIRQQRSSPLQQEGETTVLLPLDWFETDPDALLLYLRCLEPTAISLPASSLPSAVAQGAMNVGLWLQEQLDTAAQALNWVLLPSLSVNAAMRGEQTVLDILEPMLAELQGQIEIPMPSRARGAYRDLQWEDLALRLYAVTWQLPTAIHGSDWSLLLVLGTQPGTMLPVGIQLEVRDGFQVLEQPVLTERSQGYLYAQVLGTQHEQFWVTISLANGAAMTLPPFTFSLDRQS